MPVNNLAAKADAQYNNLGMCGLYVICLNRLKLNGLNAKLYMQRHGIKSNPSSSMVSYYDFGASQRQ